MFYNLLTNEERERINAENERLLKELLAGEHYPQKWGYYRNVLSYFSHKEEMVKLHNLIKSLCLKVDAEHPKTIAVGSPVDFSDRSSVAAQLYYRGDGILSGRYEFDKYPEAEKVHGLWQNLSLEEKHLFINMCFEHMFGKAVDEAYKKEAEEAAAAEERLADMIEFDCEGFPGVSPV